MIQNMSMTHEEKLFLHKLDELEARIVSNDPYVVLGASGLIRSLLLDKNRLVDQVNKHYDIEISFVLQVPENERPASDSDFTPTASGVGDTINPECPLSPGMVHERVSRDVFLNKTVLTFEGREFSIKDVIKYEAEAMGAIHLESPIKEKHRVIHGIAHFFQYGDERGTLRQLVAIARNVVLALTPLKKCILERYGM